MRPVTPAEIKKFVADTVEELTEEVKEHNDWNDRVFEEVDSWWSSRLGTGRIDELGDYPVDESDVNQLMSAVVILQTAVQEDWGLADDTGLWEGVPPWAAVLSQAFFTLEQAIGQQEPRGLE